MNKLVLSKLPLDFKSDIGAPMPKVLADEFFIYLLFFAKEQNKSGKFICLFKFNSILHKFGYPNDEAIEGHKYYKIGLEAYGFYEVVNSDWIEEVREANKVHSYHSDERFDLLYHYIFTFHDSVFECLASKYEIRKFQDTDQEKVLKKVLSRLSEEL